MDTFTALIDRLKYLLRHSDRLEVKRRKRIVYQSLPLLSDAKFEGHSLRKLMSPHVAGSGTQTEDLFDSWLWPRKNPGDGDSLKDLGSKSSSDVTDFVSGAEDFGVQTVRLLYVLGNADGATLETTQNSIVVHHGDVTYGIIDGLVSSRFCSGMAIEVDHMRVLTESRWVTISNPVLCRLYREAMRKGKGVDKALIALHIGHPKFNFRRISQAKVFDPPTPNRMKSLSIDLARGHDPVGNLYLALVPRYMGRGHFSALFGKLATRNLDPTDQHRQRYINAMYRYFHDLRVRNSGRHSG